MAAHKSIIRYRIGIAEDNELMLEGITAVLRREKGFSICGVAIDKKSTLTLVEQKKPDVLLLSLFLKGADGIDLVKHLAARFPQTRVVITCRRQPGTLQRTTPRSWGIGVPFPVAHHRSRPH